nr:hypothetical protein CFP56_57907 [Quercus suber]
MYARARCGWMSSGCELYGNGGGCRSADAVRSDLDVSDRCITSSTYLRGTCTMYSTHGTLARAIPVTRDQSKRCSVDGGPDSRWLGRSLEASGGPVKQYSRQSPRHITHVCDYRSISATVRWVHVHTSGQASPFELRVTRLA